MAKLPSFKLKQKTEEDVFEGLNNEQKVAAAHINGPNCIVAGPGAGKTRVIVVKTANMIKNNISPKNIILFTFTNKAASELKERVMKFVGKKAEQLTVGTYHSVCARLLRQYAECIGYTSRFTILDSDDSKAVISELCKGTNMQPSSIAYYISEQKRKHINASQAVKMATGLDEKRSAIYMKYEIRLKKQNLMDFDDLIFNMVKLLENNPDVKKELNEKYKYIVADEAHDSAILDLRLIELLGGKDKQYTLVLDPDQSIYAFRGADIESVMDFVQNTSNMSVYVLNQNYRSSQLIVNASCSLIGNNEVVIDKNLFSLNDFGDKIIFSESKTQIEEAEKIVQFIKLMITKYGLNYKDVAILYRMGNCAKPIEEVFIKHGVPYHIYGGIQFFARKEIKDLLSYVKFAYNPFDYEAFKRIVKVPKKGIGDATIDKMYQYCMENECDLIEASKEFKGSKKAKENLKELMLIINDLQCKYFMSSAKDCLTYIIDTIKYYDILLNEYENDEEEYGNRMANIEELLSICESYTNIEELIEKTSLDDVVGKEKDEVSLMTLHASKGLEYECVIISNCNDGYIPHFKANTEKAIEEERRLMYVGLTRAKKYLFLTRAKNIKYNYENRSYAKSRFLNEINEQFIFKIN